MVYAIRIETSERIDTCSHWNKNKIMKISLTNCDTKTV